jgi:hypothetical protein
VLLIDPAMTTKIARRIGLGGFLAIFCACAPFSRAQYTSVPIALGTGGYTLNFEVLWTCDDSPSGTASAPGEVDLVDAQGNAVASMLATASGTTPVITVTGAGSASNVTSAIHIEGADGTPADGVMHGTWNISGPAAGPYTLRFWAQTRSISRESASSITTDARDAGGSGPVSAPTPTPTPTTVPSPPSIALSAPASATVLQAVGIGATASTSSGGHPLASVAIQVSFDNGNTWSGIVSDLHPSAPSDSEGVSYPFGSAGIALLRAVATDTSGVSAAATQAVAVARATQPAILISPALATTSAGQGIAFTASGGASGFYSWGGSASGTGPSQTVAFSAPGTYSVTVLDVGNADYGASPIATATINVLAPFFTLSAAASAGGTVAGGGSYPSNSMATAVATPGAGFSFAGWTGDVTAGSPSISVLMNSDKAVTAHFGALLAQTISFVPPGPVTTRTPTFTISAIASSGLPVSLALDSGPAALSGDLVTPTGVPGEVTLVATQPGNSQYLPAQPVVVSFMIASLPAGVLFADDSASTKKSDRATRVTSYTSGLGH